MSRSNALFDGRMSNTSKEGSTLDGVIGMFNELRLILQEMCAQVHRQERVQQNLNNEMNQQLRDINQQLQEGTRVGGMGMRPMDPRPHFRAFSVDRGTFHQGHVRFYRGVCHNADRARELTTGQWKGM